MKETRTLTLNLYGAFFPGWWPSTHGRRAVGADRRDLKSPHARARAVLAVVLFVLASILLLAEKTAAVAVTVPYAANPVADAALDGDPATGDWAGAASTAIPLENGEAGGYGTATLYAKHDGATAYFRIDGQIDVPWTSAAGDHFWLAVLISDTGNTHHGAGTWDGVLFGLWDGVDYPPMPTYPPSVVDVTGYAKPPTKDAAQSALGTLRYSGAAAPYAFTAEWKKPLASGDAEDLTYNADGATLYNFFVTTDSDGGGSAGGAIRHRQVTNANTMVFASSPSPNTAPTMNLSAPDGGEDWTGASVHSLFWNMSDAETAVTSLAVWLNYSTDGGLSWSPIAGAQGISGLPGAASYAWTVPTVDTVQARVRATVVDGGGLAASDTSLANFQVDSTAPTATGSPTGAGVSVGTWVNVTFSEAMDVASAEAGFELRRVSDWALVATTLQGWTGNVMTQQPTISLAFGTAYQGNVSTAARDASDPGNPLAALTTFTFTTQPPSDTVPPVVTGATAAPDPQESGGTVNITADVTDDVAVAGVWVEVFDPSAASLGNYSMGPATPPTYYDAAAYTALGTYTYAVWAEDTSGNGAGAVGSFVIQDTLPPTVSGATAVPSPQQAGVPVNVSAAVTDGGTVVSVVLDLVDPNSVPSGPFPLLYDGGSGRYYLTASYGVVGTWNLTITATDWASNTGTASGTFAIVDGAPPEIFHTPVSGALVSVPVLISAQVLDGGGVGDVRLNYTDVLGVNQNVTMTYAGGLYVYTIPGQPSTGTVCYFLWAADASANTNRTAEYCFPVLGSDGTPPTVDPPVATPDPQESGLAVNLTVHVTDNIAVAGVWVEVFDPGTALLGNFSMAYDIPSDRYYIVVAYAPLGLYTLQVHAQDTSGNWATAAGSFVVQDTIAPAVGPLAATPDPQETGLPVNVTALVTDTVLVQTVSAAVTDPFAVLLGNFSMTRLGATDTYYFERLYAGLGTYSVEVWAGDLSGNWATAGIPFTIVDTQPPAILSVAASPALQDPGLSVNVSADVTDNVAVQSVAADITGPGGAPVGNFTLARLGATDTYSFERAYSLLGNYGVVVWALDTSGRITSAPAAFEIRDMRPPTIAHTPPGPVLVGAPIHLAAQVTDDVSVSDVRVDFIDVSLARFNVSMTPNGTTLELDIPGQPAPGNVTYFVWAMDGSGNTAVSGTFSVAVLPPVVPDTAPPVLTNVAAAPTPQNVGGTVNVTARASDDTALAGVWVEVYAPGGSLLTNATAGYDVVGGTFFFASSYVPTGPYTFRVVAVDASGNWAAVPGSFVIADLQPPVADAGPDRTAWIGSVITLDGSGSTDNVGVMNHTWSFDYDGAPVRLYSAVTSFRFNGVGTFTVMLTVADAAGLTDSDALVVTVLRDTTPPPTPAELVVAPGTEGCIGITWRPSEADDLEGYRVYRFNASREGFEWIATLDPDDTAFQDCGLEAGFTGLYWVVAFDANGTVSPPSEIVEWSIPEEPEPPSGPGILPVAALIGVVAGVIVALAALLRRRKRQPPPQAGPAWPPPPPEEAPPVGYVGVWPPPQPAELPSFPEDWPPPPAG